MVIRRVTVEIDDSIDKIGGTSSPKSLTERKEIPENEPTAIPKKDKPTNIPEDGEDSQETVSTTKGSPPDIRGRTYSDLIHESLNSPRSMATILMIIAFVIFVIKIDSIFSFCYPIGLGILLNIIWFGVPFITNLRKKS